MTFKLAEGVLDGLTNVTNRSYGQTQFLFELCDYNFSKLLELERKIKNAFYMCCPGDKEAVAEVLKMKERSNYFKLNFIMTKPSCRFKDMPELTGNVSNELHESRCGCCNHTKFPAQWGVNWDDSLSKLIREKNLGVANYWQDKSELEVLLVKNSKDEELWGFDPTAFRKKMEYAIVEGKMRNLMRERKLKVPPTKELELYAQKLSYMLYDEIDAMYKKLKPNEKS